MANNYLIDIWCEEMYNPAFENVESIFKGKRLMKSLYMKGLTDIRMYVTSENENGVRWYYKMKENGTIVKENNKFDN